MKKVRGIIALAVAITLGFVAVKAVSYYLRKPEKQKPIRPVEEIEKQKDFSKIPEDMRVVAIKVDEVSGVSRKLQKGDIVDVIATTPIPAGDGSVSRIILRSVTVYSASSGNVEVAKRLVSRKKFWTVSLLLNPDNAALLTAAAKESDITLMARSKICQDETEKADDDKSIYVFSKDKGVQTLPVLPADICKKIPENMRAVTIEIKETDGICGVLRPKDRVDLLVTCGIAGTAGNDYSAGKQVTIIQFQKRTRTVLQNLEVLAAENFVKTGIDSSGFSKRVTLIVSPQDAVVITSLSDGLKGARGKGSFKLVVRNSGDKELSKTGKVDLADIMTNKRFGRHKVVVYKKARISVKMF